MSEGRGRRSRVLQGWIRELNCLDPFIHRMVFQYVRALFLFEDDYWEEGITALDGAVDVGLQFWAERLNRSGGSAMASSLVSSVNADRLDLLNKLRNYFGAHPSLSKW